MEKTKNIRIGNDVVVRWAILTEGEARPLAGRDLRLYVACQYLAPRLVTDWTRDGNVVVWRFLGRDQKRIGLYSLILVENNGKEGMHTVDHCAALRLVAHSEEAEMQGAAAELTSSFDYDAVGALSERVTLELQTLRGEIAQRYMERTEAKKRMDEIAAQIEDETSRAKEAEAALQEDIDTKVSVSGTTLVITAPT